MILHDFIYEWDGRTRDGNKPISWWPGSYHVRIIKLSTNDENVSFLVPYAVLLKNAKIQTPMKNTSLKNYIHTFAQKISDQYNLDMRKTLWLEIDDAIRVTRLNPAPKLAGTTLFDISWRDIRPNELEMLKPYMDDM